MQPNKRSVADWSHRRSFANFVSINPHLSLRFWRYSHRPRDSRASLGPTFPERTIRRSGPCPWNSSLLRIIWWSIWTIEDRDFQAPGRRHETASPGAAASLTFRERAADHRKQRHDLHRSAFARRLIRQKRAEVFAAARQYSANQTQPVLAPPYGK